MATLCPSCQAELPPGELACPSCGSIGERGTVPSEPCPVCGLPMAPGSEVCLVCSAAAGQGKSGPVRVKSIGEEATVSGSQIVCPAAGASAGAPPAEYSELLFDAAP
ncbi:MAG TPA: zinc-ribbon domain-containing protein, partial [Gemmataceae bacterium]|nr:zinc-ribbon domain-containing protein [Gemmataceae bacterium]